MKKFTALLMLFVLGALLCPAGQVFAEDIPEEEVPELYEGTCQVMVFDAGSVNLTEEPEPEPEPEPGTEPSE